jgi:hypothetical protein
VKREAEQDWGGGRGRNRRGTVPYLAEEPDERRRDGNGTAHRYHDDGDKVLMPPKPAARLLELLLM